jgi:hypothetical protein
MVQELAFIQLARTLERAYGAHHGADQSDTSNSSAAGGSQETQASQTGQRTVGPASVASRPGINVSA